MTKYEGEAVVVQPSKRSLSPWRKHAGQKFIVRGTGKYHEGFPEVERVENGGWPELDPFTKSDGDKFLFIDEKSIEYRCCPIHKTKKLYHDRRREWFCPFCES